MQNQDKNSIIGSSTKMSIGDMSYQLMELIAEKFLLEQEVERLKKLLAETAVVENKSGEGKMA